MTQGLRALVFIYSFIAGVLLSSFVPVSIYFALLPLLVGLAVLASRSSVLIALVLIAFSLGCLRYEVKDRHALPEALTESVDTNVTRTGLVVSELESRENSTRFVLKDEETRERILVNTSLYSEVKYGDVVTLTGKLGRPGIIEDESGREFNYASYLSKDDIYFTMSFAKVEVLEVGQGNFLKAFLYKVKQAFIAKVGIIFAEPESSLLAGLVVAGKDAMPKSVVEEFRRAGIVHIVVLSGYNITIIAEFIRRVVERVLLTTRTLARPGLAAGASMVGILLFVLMTGAQATVVRAAIMALVVVGAKLSGRAYSAPRALVAAAFVMILENPKILVFDPSFQLSFLAMLGLICVSPILERVFSKVPTLWGVREILVTTLATQATVLPFLIHSVGDLSLVSLPANILTLLIVPYTMLVGFVAVVLAFISQIVALPLTFIAHLMLAWILGVAHFFGTFSFATVEIHFSTWMALLIYVALAILISRSRSSPHKSAN